MGILDKILGRGPRTDGVTEELTEDNCPHTALAPHWENPDDMGNDEAATYRCESCGETFSYNEAREFLEKPPSVLTAVSEPPDLDEKR